LEKEMFLQVVVRPRAGRTGISGTRDGALRVDVKEPPEDGRANDAVCALLARELGIPKDGVRVVSGQSSRKKLLAISGAPQSAVERLLKSDKEGED
jgi:uncharacterized protein (TIGR00251 family)